MQAFHYDAHAPLLPEGHRFPMDKYRRLRERVAARLPGVRLMPAPSVTLQELCSVHDPDYVRQALDGSLSGVAMREIGFPWTAQLAERARRSVGATCAALGAAQAEGLAINLAGGTHHAGIAQGGGFCIFNDVAVAVRTAQQRGVLRRAAVIDLDVHQGNGTAAIFAGNSDVYTLSVHGERNFPFRKVASTLDVGLPDGCGDAAYLGALDDALAQIDAAHRRQAFDVVFYLAGADVHEGDRLGRLSVSSAGVHARDARVMALAEAWACPLVMCMAGGYGVDLDRMIELQLGTVDIAWQAWMRRQTGPTT